MSKALFNGILDPEVDLKGIEKVVDFIKEYQTYVNANKVEVTKLTIGAPIKLTKDFKIHDPVIKFEGSDEIDNALRSNFFCKTKHDLMKYYNTGNMKNMKMTHE